MSIIQFLFEGYYISFSEEYKDKCSIYDYGWVYGLKFNDINGEYDISHNREVAWNRIHIIPNIGSHKDLPFNENTLELLPNWIKIEKKIQ